MGSSFANLALRGPAQADVCAYMTSAGMRAYIGPTARKWVLIAEERSETFDFDVLRALAEELTAKFDCAGLSMQFYDDDVLLLQVYKSGAFVESYSSNPAYGAEDIVEMLEFDRGGDAEKIALAFEMPQAVQDLQQALHGQEQELDEEYGLLNERLADAMQSGDMEAFRQVQLRLMEKTRELSESGEDPFLKYSPGFAARRRYAGLVQALALPPFCQDFGYKYLSEGETPDGLDRSALLVVRAG